MQVLILSADQYRVVNDSGEVIEGVTVWYLNDYRDASQQSVGFKPTKISAQLEMWPVLKGLNLPALCELDFVTRPGAQGKPTLQLRDIKHLQAVELF
jgi:hypothetical protein